VAERALGRGQTLLVFPGGEIDAFRPFGDRYRVKFGGRAGFVRFARRAGAKLVPLAICGSQAAYVTLPGAATVARGVRLQSWTGLKRFPLTLGGVAVATTLAMPPLWPLALPMATLAALPLPTRIEARFLPPVSVDPSETDDEAAERVRRSLEGGLQAMSAHRTTFLG
jgi:1-acyl-sn-glycerol-3-phosphate acyltransferase